VNSEPHRSAQCQAIPEWDEYKTYEGDNKQYRQSDGSDINGECARTCDGYEDLMPAKVIKFADCTGEAKRVVALFESNPDTRPMKKDAEKGWWQAGVVAVKTKGTNEWVASPKFDLHYSKKYKWIVDGNPVAARNCGADQANNFLLRPADKQYKDFLQQNAHDPKAPCRRTCEGYPAPAPAPETGNAECMARNNLNAFSDGIAMTHAGWQLDFTDPDMTDEDMSQECGNGKNWFGWSGADNVGSAKTTLNGDGVATLEFGNCWSEGSVNVYLNDVLIASATGRQYRKLIKFSFSDGATLEIKDEGGNSVVQLHRFHCFNKAPETHKYWRVGNAGETDRKPAVRELRMFRDSQCTDQIDVADIEQAVCSSQSKDVCARTIDGDGETMWTPNCQKTASGDHCGANQAWVGVKLKTPAEIKCAKADNLGQGSKNGDAWNVGLVLSASETGALWNEIARSDRGNSVTYGCAGFTASKIWTNMDEWYEDNNRASREADCKWMCSHKNSEHSKTCQCYEYSREGDGTCVHHMTEKTGAGGNAGNAPKTNMAGAGPDKIDGGAGATSGVIVAILGTIVTIVVLAVMFYIWHRTTVNKSTAGGPAVMGVGIVDGTGTFDNQGPPMEVTGETFGSATVGGAQ